MKTIFQKYFNSTLTPDEFDEFTQLVKSGDSNEFDQAVRSVWEESMEGEPETQSNPALLGRIKQSIWKEKHEAVVRKLNVYQWTVRIAAVLVMGLFVAHLLDLTPLVEKSEVQMVSVSTPHGARTQVDLPDGSKAWLNAGSSISYPVRFADERPVRLVGEAYFDVKKRTDQFKVQTDRGEVSVLGTSFNVKAYADESAFETTLEEGSVLIHATGARKAVKLSPGQQAKLLDGKFNIANVDTRLHTSWKEGKLILDKEPFPSFMKKLERWYGVTINSQGFEDSDLWYTGTIEMESITEVMDLVSKAAPIAYKYDHKKRVFSIRLLDDKN